MKVGQQNYSLVQVKEGEVCGTYGERKMYTGFWWGNLKKGDHLEDLGVDGRITLKRTLKKENGKAFTGLIWLKIGPSGGLL